MWQDAAGKDFEAAKAHSLSDFVRFFFFFFCILQNNVELTLADMHTETKVYYTKASKLR